MYRWELSLSAFCVNQRVGRYSANRKSSPGQTLYGSALFLGFDVKDFGDKDLRVPSPVRSPANGLDALLKLATDHGTRKSSNVRASIFESAKTVLLPRGANMRLASRP